MFMMELLVKMPTPVDEEDILIFDPVFNVTVESVNRLSL